MAKKLNSTESELFEEAIKQTDPACIVVPPDHFLRRLQEQQAASVMVSQLAQWLSEDPLSQR